MFKQITQSIKLHVKSVLLFVLFTMLSACSVFGIRDTEEAEYAVIKQDGDFQLREYAKLVVAETVIESDFDQAEKVAFNRLFDYISGENVQSQNIPMTAPVLVNRENDGSQKISMTAPVIKQKQNSAWRYYFVLPDDLSLSTAPSPINPDVRIKEIPPKLVSSIEYTGLWDEETFNEKTRLLESWIAENDLERLSSPSFAGYDPPWTLPFFRRNEVLIDVKR